MRIDPKPSVQPVSTEPRETPRAAGQAPGAAAATVVALSAAGSAAANATSEPHSGMTARLDKIRKLIAENRYPIDLDKLADRITDDELMRTRRTP